MSKLQRYYIDIVDMDTEQFLYTFSCDADSGLHAIEQAQDAISHGEALGTIRIGIDLTEGFRGGATSRG